MFFFSVLVHPNILFCFLFDSWNNVCFRLFPGDNERSVLEMVKREFEMHLEHCRIDRTTNVLNYVSLHSIMN